MKTFKYTLLLLLALLLGTPVEAQYHDARGRLTSTIIADGLAQLPTKNLNDYYQLMDEMARTGSEGIESLAAMLQPAQAGKNATFEYAINGIVSYVSAEDQAQLRTAVHDGLVSAIQKCSDKVNKAFLLSQLQKIATTSDEQLAASLLGDKDLKDAAVAVLCQIPSADADIEAMLQEGTLPKDALAYIAYERRLASPKVEEALLSWLPTADDKAKAAIYNALTISGTARSLKTLGAAAKATGYNMDTPTSVTDAYLQLLTRLQGSETKTVAKAAKELQKQQNPALRCAGLLLDLGTTADQQKVILRAVKDGCKQYRNTALLHAEEYAGKGIYEAVAKVEPKLTDAQKVDVLAWLGNNHRTEQVQTVLSAIGSSDEALALTAIEAAGRIGGNEALQALMAQLGTAHADAATAALKSFRGSIGSSMLQALDATDAKQQAAVLNLLAQRRVNGSYGKIMQLVDSSEPAVSEAACKALKEAVDENNFTAVCQKLEQASGTKTALLQDAAVSALRNLKADEQYSRINTLMQKSAKPALYYPMLAQAGNKQAVSSLLKAYAEPSTKDAAYRALLRVDSPEMIDVLYNIAKKDASVRDEALGRYIALVRQAKANDAVTYLNVERALELKPSRKVANSLTALLTTSSVYPAVPLVAAYQSQEGTDLDAATIVKTLVAKHAGFQGGNYTRGLISETQKTLSKWKQKGYADAGYALDEINGVLPKFKDYGYAPVGAEQTVGRKTTVLDQNLENFEAYVEWKTDGAGLLSLRSMPALVLDPASVRYAHATGKGVAAKKGDWNLLYVKLTDDRLTVVSNGVTVCDNIIMQNTPTDAQLLYKGNLSLVAGEGAIQLRRLYVNRLPATPVAKLSTEEAKQGFKLLFDGRSLSQWHGNTTNYVPRDGCIYVNAHYGTGGNLYSNKKYSDFIYRFEFSFVSPGVNNGIGIRTRENTDAAYEGMEIQVLDHDDPIYADLHPYQQHGAVYGIIVPKHVKFGKLGTWNTEEIRAIGDHITVTVNGEVILDGNIREACQGHNVAPDGSDNNPYTMDHHNHPGLFNKSGNISFCGHGEGVMFRNIRILDLSKKKK